MAFGWVKRLLGNTQGTSGHRPQENRAVSHPTPVSVPALPAQPTATVVDYDTVVNLPWLISFDIEMEKYGFEGVHAKIKVTAGTSVYVDATNQRARIIEPSGRIRSWDRTAQLMANPAEPSWQMTWLVKDSDNPQIIFSPMTENCDDEIIQKSGYEFYCEGIEGNEEVRFAQMLKLLKDPFYNPLGFPLQSGIYKQEMVSECFDLNFGENGSPPRLSMVAETMPAQLDFPYQTEINVVEPISVDGDTIPAGYYRTEVRGFHVKTGEVRSISVYHMGNRFNMSGAQMVEYIHRGKIEILNILQDERPNF